MDALAGVRAKVARSLEHMVCLDEAVGEYLESDPLDVVRQIQPDGHTSVFALRVKELPPLDLAVRIGDVVHQLRSSLDHLAYQLVVAAKNTPTERTVFPILERRPRQLTVHGGVSNAALGEIERFQPYQRTRDPDQHPLALLHRLWNIDKHRMLALTATKLRRSQIFVHDPWSRASVGGQFQPQPLGDNDIIGVFRFERQPSPDSEVLASGEIFVAYADPGPWGTDRAATVILEEIHQYVATTLLPRFDRFL